MNSKATEFVSVVASAISRMSIGVILGGMMVATTPTVGTAMKIVYTIGGLTTAMYAGDKVGSYVSNEITETINTFKELGSDVKECVSVIKDSNEVICTEN